MKEDELKKAFKSIKEGIELLENCFITEKNKSLETYKCVEEDTLREMLNSKLKNGKSEGIKNIFKTFGAERLSEIKPENYEVVLKMAENL